MSDMKLRLGISFITAAFLLCLAYVEPADAASLNWTDLSANIPTSTLDETFDYPLLSFASGRGTDWLCGNPSKLFLVTSKGVVFDLTPELKKSGFQKIRQVASDGQNWLVIGDSGPWHAQPDLAFRYDGLYWKNVSRIMNGLPAQEWVGKIAGKRGTWLIPTRKSLFIWQNSLSEVAHVPLPPELRDSGYTDMVFYPTNNLWLVAAKTKNGPLYYLFDGMGFAKADGLIPFGNVTPAIGTNGAAVLAISAHTAPKPVIMASYFDGTKSYRMDTHFTSFVDYKNNFIRFFPESSIVWNGKSWMLADRKKHLAMFNGREKAFDLQPTRDNFVESAYGKDGLTLHAGYTKDAIGRLIPRLALSRQP